MSEEHLLSMFYRTTDSKTHLEMEYMSHTSIQHDAYTLNHEKSLCHEMVTTENVRFDQAYRDGSYNGAAVEMLCFSQRLPFCPILHHSRRGTGGKASVLMCSEQLCRNKSFQNEACSSFTLTN